MAETYPEKIDKIQKVFKLNDPGFALRSGYSLTAVRDWISGKSQVTRHAAKQRIDELYQEALDSENGIAEPVEEMRRRMHACIDNLSYDSMRRFYRPLKKQEVLDMAAEFGMRLSDQELPNVPIPISAPHFTPIPDSANAPTPSTPPSAHNLPQDPDNPTVASRETSDGIGASTSNRRTRTAR